MNVYCQKELGVTPAVAAVYYTVAIVLFIVCRSAATFLMKFFNPAKMMALFAAGAIACSLGVVYLPSETVFAVGKYAFGWNIACLVAMSGFMSLMFPTIYGIALGGLDPKSVKLGAAGLIMAILGGAIITPWMAGVIGDGSSFFASLVPGFSTDWDVNLKLSQTSLRASFFVPAICFAVVGIYALAFKTEKK
jgi:FHS family L-fucose permease-like MFS transporter